jgi:hypothetical protein
MVSLNTVGSIELRGIKLSKTERASPCPCLLGLEQHGNGGVVEPREEDKIDDVPDVFITSVARSRTELGE